MRKQLNTTLPHSHSKILQQTSLLESFINKASSSSIGGCTFIPQYLLGIVSRTPYGYQNARMLESLYKVMQYLNLSYAYPPVYFKSSLDYFSYLTPCKCYANSCPHATTSSFSSWNFLEYIFPNIFFRGWLNSPV